MEAPAISTDMHRDDHVKKHLVSSSEMKDGYIIDFAKRMYAISPLLLMTYSTINQVFVVTKSITSQSNLETYDSRQVEVVSVNQEAYYTCEYGNVQAVVINCPYNDIPAFVANLSIWVLYFVCFLSIRFAATFKYSTNDLRFYLAVDLFNSHWLNRLFVVLGGLLTFASMCVSVGYLTDATGGEWNPTVDNTSVLSIILFVGINALALSGFRKQFIETNSSVHMETFQDVVPIYNVKFFHGVDRVMTPILVAYVRYLATNDDSELQLRGDVSALRRALSQLYKLD